MPSKIKNISLDKTKETFDKIMSQAKDSVKILETLQKEGLERARSMLPSADETVRLTNEKIASTLKKLGFVTRSEVEELERKVEDLASELRGQITKLSRKKKDEESSQH